MSLKCVAAGCVVGELANEAKLERAEARNVCRTSQTSFSESSNDKITDQNAGDRIYYWSLANSI
ncbi:hypothetical protein VFPPC_15446 [Pochonia chlamydosporia 170]|uniref:Uncharacterized protein n=1 Tax=Pochonia chlamydosporia 170 TaxID=1380566 RepID=A0A179G945_METCM|nr:hypothetical protein VFPPC_15446 [Pochonia chlamydosporia 170]OAQ74332.1 hypothetical protein VFPPC_15446 [Pochonia chlamydosporia 170]